MHRIIFFVLTLFVSCGDNTQELTGVESTVASEISFGSAEWKKDKAIVVIMKQDDSFIVCSAQWKSGSTFAISCPKEISSGDKISVSAPKGAFTISGKDSKGLNNYEVTMK